MSSTPLSLQLQITAKVVAGVQAGRSLQELLADGAMVKPELRSGVQALSFAVLRHFGLAQALRNLLAERDPAPAVDALLCTALSLLVCGEAAGATYTEFTLVNQAVEAAKANSKTRTSSSFVNALLRRFLREREALLAEALKLETARYNHPQWWIDQLRKEQPQAWEAILAANQAKPALTLRVNVSLQSQSDYMALLAASGVACEAAPLHATPDIPSSGVVVQDAAPVPSLPRYAEGGFSVQDAAAQGAAVQLLSPDFLAKLIGIAKTGQKIRILDACAAPGGKTTHLMELLTKAFREAGMSSETKDGVAFADMPFVVVALEVDGKRAKRINDNLARLKLRATVKVADAARPTDWWDGQMFDAILLDAPCTASGIVRRHPDVRWLRRPSDALVLSQTQGQLLRSLWPCLAVGGRLLYATCSVFRAEGVGVVEPFCEQYKGAKWLDSHGLWLPSAHNDGFYDALLEKTTV